MAGRNDNMIYDMGASDGARCGDAAWRLDAVEVPVPDDECNLVLADSRGGRMIAAAVEQPETQPSASASGSATLPAVSMVDLKGLADLSTSTAQTRSCSTGSTASAT
eukprot:14756454-Heterocapsa_arctica.AAC.1